PAPKAECRPITQETGRAAMPAAASRIVLVTGAAGGIGSAITGALVAAGHRVGAVDRDQMALDKLVAENSDVHPIVGDLAQEADCTRAVAECVQHFGHVDAVINNAGIGMSSIRPDAEARHPRIAELSAEIWDRFYAINVRGHILITRAALPHMQAKKWGRIVNNTTSFITMLRVLPYGAMKSTLNRSPPFGRKSLRAAASPSMCSFPADRRTRRSFPMPPVGRATRCCGPRSWGPRPRG